MLKKVSLLVLANICVLAFIIAIYAIGYGYGYDKAHKLYPEMKRMSYDWSMQVYGQRWERTAKFLLLIGGIANVVIMLTWYRKRQNKSNNFLDLDIKT